jgi:spore germination cell wall hydrolase CwlJ-like protein
VIHFFGAPDEACEAFAPATPQTRAVENHLFAQRKPETFWEVDRLYPGIEG